MSDKVSVSLASEIQMKMIEAVNGRTMPLTVRFEMYSGGVVEAYAHDPENVDIDCADQRGFFMGDIKAIEVVELD